MTDLGQSENVTTLIHSLLHQHAIVNTRYEANE